MATAAKEFKSLGSVPTSDLRVGDVVLCHGMRCLITEPVKPVHNGQAWSTRSLITNRQEVPYASVPRSFTYLADHSDKISRWEEHRWYIKGNDLALWRVERPVEGWNIGSATTGDEGEEYIEATGPQPVIATRPAHDGGTAQLRPNGMVDAVDGKLYSSSPGFESFEELEQWIEEELAWL